MGSYTANYQLYMAAAAEQGWGDLQQHQRKLPQKMQTAKQRLLQKPQSGVRFQVNQRM